MRAPPVGPSARSLSKPAPGHRRPKGFAVTGLANPQAGSQLACVAADPQFSANGIGGAAPGPERQPFSGLDNPFFFFYGLDQLSQKLARKAGS
jgi:hypothetical protein